MTVHGEDDFRMNGRHDGFVCKMNQSLYKIYLFKRNVKEKHNERNQILKTNERIEEESEYRNWNVVLIHWGTFIFIYELKRRRKKKFQSKWKNNNNVFLIKSITYISFRWRKHLKKSLFASCFINEWSVQLELKHGTI